MKIPFDSTKVQFAALASGFNPNNALYLAAASNLAYEDSQKIEQQVGEWGYPKYRFLDAGGSTQGFVCANDQVLWLVFRGTEVKKLNDIFTDLEFELVKNPGGGKTHIGFSRGIAEVWSEVNAAFEELYTHQSIWISGHSLGAALAILAAERLHREKQLTAQGIYTFGQPRVGNFTYSRVVDKAFPKRCLRFVNNNDIVPRVPPPGLILRYWHSLSPMYIDAESRLRPNISLVGRVWEDLKGAFKDLGKVGIDALKDHSMDRYMEDMVKIAASEKG